MSSNCDYLNFQVLRFDHSKQKPFNGLIYFPSWKWERLPPPPLSGGSSVYSHAVLDGGRIICVSAYPFGGTYLFDTVRREWMRQPAGHQRLANALLRCALVRPRPRSLAGRLLVRRRRGRQRQAPPVCVVGPRCRRRRSRKGLQTLSDSEASLEERPPDARRVEHVLGSTPRPWRRQVLHCQAHA